ncbi:MAG: hypothetical protein M3P18_19655 [Actinomycetota bacterium]|nr:hypothetical protein [Actinomycetota bacterium]
MWPNVISRAWSFLRRWRIALPVIVVLAYLVGPQPELEWSDACPSGALIQRYPNVPGRRAECFSQDGRYLGLAAVSPSRRVALYLTRPALRLFDLEFAPSLSLEGFGVCEARRRCE